MRRAMAPPAAGLVAVLLSFAFAAAGASDTDMPEISDMTLIPDTLEITFEEGVMETEFIGCFEDAIDKAGTRDLPHFVGKGNVDQCASQCKGYKYFGHQSDMQCWCGNTYGKFGRSADCACGDDSDIGGGVNCVYRIKELGAIHVDAPPDVMEKTDASPGAPTKAALRTKYMGCYDDVPDRKSTRDLPHFAGRGDVLQCAAQCEGYKYFGHQSDLQCWCGNSYGRFGKSKLCECDDSEDVGPGVNCVYKIEREDDHKKKVKKKTATTTQAPLLVI